MVIEEAAQIIRSAEFKKESKQKITSTLQRLKSKASEHENIKTKFRSLNDHKVDRSLRDKNNARVIMDIERCNSKIQKKIPQHSLKPKYTKRFTKIRRSNQSARYRLMLHYSNSPHLYGSLKIHKPDILFRPIVSSSNAPCQPLTSFLLNYDRR